MYASYPGQPGMGGGYDQRGGLMEGGQKVFGLPVPPAVYKPASNFMNMQASIFGCHVCASCISFCLTLAMYFYLKDLKSTDFSTPTPTISGGTTAPPTEAAFMISILQNGSYTYSWVGSAFGLCLTCCCGAAVVFLARSFIESRNADGLKFCCIAEGVYSGCGFCEACCMCLHLAMWITCAAGFSAAAFCKSGTTTGGGVLGTAETDAEKTCMKAMEAVQTVIYVAMTWSACLFCFACANAALCGLGAKYAKETEEAFKKGADPYAMAE